MNRETAREILAIIRKIDAAIAELDNISNRMTNDDERRALRRAMVEIVGQTYENIIRGIVQQYPDLDPDKHVRGT